MSQSISARLNGVVKGKLKELAKGHPHGYDVSATFAPVFDKNGNHAGWAHSWLVTVSIPNPLAGAMADIATSYPVQGVVPPDADFVKFTELLWESAIQQEQEALNPKPVPTEQAPAMEPAKPRTKRQRDSVSHFPSKEGSGEFAA